jgi:hypothetical protein
VRAFYSHVGFGKVADLADFYRPGDGKAVFVKALAGMAEPIEERPVAIEINRPLSE